MKERRVVVPSDDPPVPRDFLGKWSGVCICGHPAEAHIWAEYYQGEEYQHTLWRCYAELDLDAVSDPMDVTPPCNCMLFKSLDAIPIGLA